MTSTRWFSPENMQLPDGTAVVVRPLGVDDIPLLNKGLENMSKESRYHRFFFPKHCFSDQELDFLTHSDSERLSLGMATLNEAGQETSPIGVARYVKDRQDPTLAEVAIVVNDNWHHKGVGTTLLKVLKSRALEAGVTHWVGFYLNHNTGIKKLLAKVARKESESHQGEGVLKGIYRL